MLPNIIDDEFDCDCYCPGLSPCTHVLKKKFLLRGFPHQVTTQNGGVSMPYNFLLNCVPGNGLLLEGADVEDLAEPALADVVGVVLVEELPLVVDGREPGAARLVLERGAILV